MTSHDVAAALLAMPPFPMSRVPVPSKKPVAVDCGAKKANPQRCPTKPFSKRIADLFRRKHTTEWSDKEIAAYRKLTAYPDEASMSAEMDMLDAYYKSERAKGEKGIHRRDLQTFLNNFQGELDRARAFWETRQKRLTRFDPPAAPANVVPMQPEDEAELRAKAAAEFQKARAAL